MTEHIQPNIHPLLREPHPITIHYGEKLVAAYKEKIADLTGGFTSASNIARPPFPVNIYYYSDNGNGFRDTAPKEIKRFLRDSAKIVSILSGIEQPTIDYEDTLVQSWVPSGFDLAQTTRFGLLGHGNISFLNCAPRLDERGGEQGSNKGEPIYVGVLPNGHVISANSRYNFVFFRDMVENGTLEIFEADVQRLGTQFRSRHPFPLHSVVLANRLTQNAHLWKPEMTIQEARKLLEAVGYIDLSARLDVKDIPQLKKFTIATIDTQNNIKTNTRLSELTEEEREFLLHNKFLVKIGDKVLEGRYTQAMFDRKTGEGGTSPGSSGHNWIGANHDDAFLEIAIVGGSATGAFEIGPDSLRQPIEILIEPHHEVVPFIAAARAEKLGEGPAFVSNHAG